MRLARARHAPSIVREARPLPDQLVGAPIESFADLDAESAHGERTPVTADEPPIEPRRAVAFHLLVKIVAREKAYACQVAPASVVGSGANLEVLWDEPTIGAGPLDNASASQRLQAPHMSVNESLIVASADAGRRGLQHLAVSARAIDARAACDDCNVAIGATGGPEFKSRRSDQHLAHSGALVQRSVKIRCKAPVHCLSPFARRRATCCRAHDVMTD